MTTTATEIGAYLGRLRDKAGLKQNELAGKVTWSPAVLSRVESGERTLSPEELDAILEAIGTEEAMEFKETVGRFWQHLPRPPLGHPDEQILWEAELALGRIKELSDNPDVKNVIVKRLEESRSEIKTAASLVLNTEHNVAFVGKIGVGKTTALCRMAGLEVMNGDKRESVLEVGAGGTTVCEVRLQRGKGYGIHVEPIDTDAFHREVLEFARFLTRNPNEENPEDDEGAQDAHGTSKEIERVIRNMSGLTVARRRLPDGGRERIDQAGQLAEEYPDADTLAGEILARIQLQRRTWRQVWYPEISGQAPLLWLKETFEKLNNGRHPEFALPKRIDIVVPNSLLGEDPLSVCLVDTKGIDATTQRADLGAYFSEPGTLMVLCSSFNDTPSTDVQDLLSRAKDVGHSDLGVKAAILSLPRPDEALAIKDDQGTPADSVSDGYELKGEQATLRLKSQNLPYADIAFFNARDDKPQDLTDFLLRRIEAIRQQDHDSLNEAIRGALGIVENIDEAHVQEAYQLTGRQMTVWLDNNREIGDLPIRLECGLLSAINQAYASSVRASVRRQGEWYNLDYSYHLGRGARVMASRAISPKLDDFRAVTENLLHDKELEPAFDLVRQARRILNDGFESLLQRSEWFGKRIYIQHLKPDAGFWRGCDAQWGQGYGYRDRVAERHRNWFSSSERHFQTEAHELISREWRQILDRLAAILDSDVTEPVAA